MSLSELIHRGDLDELVAEVDRLVNRQDWQTVVWLRERCERAAEELGKQLWGVAQYADYRLALESPAETAATVVTPGAARFALGPLTEVVAQHHTWEELADHLDPIVAGPVAQERVLRGEDLTGDPRAAVEQTDLPLVLQPWEPAYPLPRYRADELLENGPDTDGTWEPVATPAPGRPRRAPAVTRALEDLVRPWAEQSTGEMHVAVVEGDAGSAVAAVLPGAFRLARVSLADAFAHMAWAAGSGGAHGARRGLAAGRSAAWWAGHVVAGLDWPADPDELEFALEELAWFRFDDGAESPGWRLRLAVADPRLGWAAAVDAHDTRVEIDPLRDDPNGSEPT